MRLTLQTDYALRVLMYAAVKGRTLSTVPEIVEHFDMSRGHVMKVVHRLGQRGYLETLRGKGGGVRLARRPELIGVGAVVRDMEEELGLLGCLQDRPGYCRIEECCVLRGTLHAATEAFLAVLDRHTLADLIKPRRRLGLLLAIDGAARPVNALRA
ncbi:MAG: Rrf2 family transcriptional regulator [Steroidobacteraceae bacterium]